MAELTVTNWFGNIEWHPQVVVEANSVNDIIAVMKAPDRYPPPIRAVGSIHSTARCDVADGGTIIKMNMNQILEITSNSVTVQAGAIYIDIAQELREAPAAVLCQHRNRHAIGGKRSVRRHQRLILPGRIRASRILRHRCEDGPSLRRASGGDRQAA